MLKVNSRVISGLTARNVAMSRGPDKDYVEVGGSTNEVSKDKYTLDEGVRGVNVFLCLGTVKKKYTKNNNG